MKIFTNKRYREIINNYEEQYDMLVDKATKLMEQKVDAELEIGKLIEENKKLICAKGGFTKQINKLTAEIKELEDKLAESMTDKYRVKKVPSGRTPKGQKMKIKDCTKISNIARKAYGRQEAD